MWIWSLAILLMIILITWWALAHQAGLTEDAGYGNHEHASSHEIQELSPHDNSGHPVQIVAEPSQELHVIEDQTKADQSEEKVVDKQSEGIALSEPVEVKKAADSVSMSAEIPLPTLDNLEIIEGIGPKIAGVLAAAGINTFAKLAEMNGEKIKEILTANDPRLGRIADPTSWPEQAKLAGSGDMQGLKTLQDRLKGGRG